MKKVLAIAALAVTIYSCGNEADTTAANNDSLNVPAVETTSTYTSADGDIVWKEDKLYVFKGGEWVLAEKEVTLEDGSVATLSGELKKAGQTIKLKTGETVTKVGEFFDATGTKVSNAWEATKDGVQNAADNVKEGAEKAVDNVKEGANKLATDVKDGAEKAIDKTKDAANNAADKVKDGANKAAEKTNNAVNDLKKKI